MKNVSRRGFLKAGASLASIAALPLAERMSLASPNSNFFTIGIIPDTQNYSDGTYPQPLNKNFFKEQTSYLAQNVQQLKLRFVTHVGDVVQNGDGRDMNFPTRYGTPQNTEWLNAAEALDILDASGIPWGASPGNHDYDNYSWNSKNRPLEMSQTYWNAILGSGSKYFKNKPWYGGASDNVGYISTGSDVSGYGNYFPAGTPTNYGLSSFQIFSAGGRKFLHISLQFEPGDAAIAWAQDVINAHLNYATIITHHGHLAPPDWGDNAAPLVTPAPYVGPSYLVNSPEGWHGGQDVFNLLVYPNPQVFMVLCGHAWTSTSTIQGVSGPVRGVSKGENYRIDNNSGGNPVYQLLTDYQGNTTLGSAGGDGWLRFMQFEMDTQQIYFYTVNVHQTMAGGSLVKAGQTTVFADGTSDFDQPAGFSDFTLPMPPQILRAPVGAH
jgi:hypothetical protein